MRACVRECEDEGGEVVRVPYRFSRRVNAFNTRNGRRPEVGLAHGRVTILASTPMAC